MSNGMGSQLEATGRGHDSVCFDCKYYQAVFMTNCARNESVQTGSCGSAEEKKGKFCSKSMVRPLSVLEVFQSLLATNLAGLKPTFSVGNLGS